MRLAPVIETARDWLDAHVAYENQPLFGGGIVMEPHYAPSILEGLMTDGLAVGV